MSRIFITLIFILALFGCNNHHTHKGFYNKPARNFNDSLKKRKSIDSEMALGMLPDSEQTDEPFDEVLAKRIASYNKIETVDKTIVDGKDTLRINETYYCLHDSAAIVPKKYLWGGDTTKDFITHNFATKIILLNNKDTVLNKTFLKQDFNCVLWDQLRKHAIIFDADYIGYNKKTGEFAFGYSITIPLTDVGVPVGIAINKKGKYRFLDEYAKTDAFKKS